MARVQRGSATESAPVANPAAELEARARQLVDQILQPLVAVDGGKIELVSVEGRRVTVRMLGMCSGCPGRPYTVSGVLEPAARRYLGSDISFEVESGIELG
jgi:Fe-S cluster biogenesis protein NfuA